MEIKAFIREWITKAEAYFSTFSWKNMFFFMLFLLLAFIFWLMLFFQKENVEGTYRIPLKYTNIPNDVVFDHALPEYVEISVTGNGMEIFTMDIQKKDSLEINVAELTKEGTTELQGDPYRQLIRSQLPPGINIQGYYPMSISLSTSRLASKEVPVVFDGEIMTSRANLVVDSTYFIPETVTAYGSEKALAMLESAVTEYTLFRNLKATSQLPVKIKPVEDVKFVPTQVDIYIPIKEFTEQSFEIPITARNLPKGLDVKFFPSRVTVSFSVTLEEYRKISPEDFAIELDYRDFHENEDGLVEPVLTKKPPSVRNIRISPALVEFLFESKAGQ